MIIYSRDASDDIDSIERYIRDELNNPMASQSIIDELFKTIDRLKESPFLGPSLSPFLCVDNRDLRRIVVKNYIVVYEVTSKAIIIQRVFGGRRDWMRILSENQNL